MIIKNTSSEEKAVWVRSSELIRPGEEKVIVGLDRREALPEGVTIKEDLSEVHPRFRTPTIMLKDEKKEDSKKQKLND